MKRKNQTFNKELKMPRLFREDLEFIEKIIKEELQPREYKIETREYEYETVDLIPRDHETVTELHIQTYTPYISIDFNRYSARVYAADDDLKTTGALTKIIEILIKKERKISYWSQEIAIYLTPFLFGALFTFIITRKIELTRHWLAIGIFILILVVVWWAVSFYSMFRFSEINFFTSKKRQNFLQRNKDQIILLIIGAFAGAVFTVLIQGIFQK